MCLKTEKFDFLICDIVLRDGENFNIDAVSFVPTIFITAVKHVTHKAIDIEDITTVKVEYIVKRFAKKIIQNGSSAVFVRTQKSSYMNKSKITQVTFSENNFFTLNKEFAVSKVFKIYIYEFHHFGN
jgi:hypothetical protein